MNEKNFSSFKDAADYACSIAQEAKVSIKVLRASGGWIVRIPNKEQPAQEQVSHQPSSATTIEVQAKSKSVESNEPKKPASSSTKLKSQSHEEEWEELWDLVSRAAQGIDANQGDVLTEFSRLIKKENPFALRAQQELIEHEKNSAGPRISTAYEKGAVLFRAFSAELPILRG